jgi:hypothetical protein
MIRQSETGVVASLSLPRGQFIRENEIFFFEIKGASFPMGTSEEKPFASVAEAVKHFTDAGFSLTPIRP